MLASFLADPVKAFAQCIAAGHQLFALLGVLGHQVQGLLQHQAGFAQLLMLQSALLLKFAQFFLQPAPTQLHLFGTGPACRKAGLELAMLAALFLGATA
ncbi:hypothetical protein D3C79_675320 [compost metagenome]